MTLDKTIQWDEEAVCLVTGGGGFIGSHLVRELVRQGKQVFVLDANPDASYVSDCMDRVTFIFGDVADMPHLAGIMADHRVTHIFHLACWLVPDTENRLATAIHANCGGFHNVLEAARLCGVKRVIWPSTQSVYGLAQAYPPGPVREDVFVEPVTLYGACKLFNEHLARHYRKTYGLDIIGFRKSVVYGLGKSRRRDLSIAHLLVENGLLGRRLVLPPVDYYANYVYVKDIVRAYLLAARAGTHDHAIFNIGGHVWRNSEVAALLERLRGPLEVYQQQTYGLPHPIEVYDQDQSRACDELGYEPAYPLAEGIEDYLATLDSLGQQYRSALTEWTVTSLP